MHQSSSHGSPAVRVMPGQGTIKRHQYVDVAQIVPSGMVDGPSARSGWRVLCEEPFIVLARPYQGPQS